MQAGKFAIVKKLSGLSRGYSCNPTSVRRNDTRAILGCRPRAMPLQLPADPQIIQDRSAGHRQKCERTLSGIVPGTQFDDRRPFPLDRKVNPHALGIVERRSFVGGEAGERVEQLPCAVGKVGRDHPNLNAVFGKMHLDLHANQAGKVDRQASRVVPNLELRRDKPQGRIGSSASDNNSGTAILNSFPGRFGS